MTSRAEQALPAKQRLFAALHGDDDVPSWLRQIAEDIEQEVRDDIAARVEALPGMNGRHDAVGGALEVSREAVLAAISSSSATETQDEWQGPEYAAALNEHLGGATETQDGERPGHESEWWSGCADHVHPDRTCGYCSAKFHRLCASVYATPTPDDRERKVERIRHAIEREYERGTPTERMPAALNVRALATPDDRDREYHEHVAGDKHSHPFSGPHSHGGVSTLIDDRDREVERIADDAWRRELRRLRGARRRSLRSLGLAVDADFTHLSKIENGHDRPSRDLVVRLDTALAAGGDIVALFDGLPCPRCGRRDAGLRASGGD